MDYTKTINEIIDKARMTRFNYSLNCGALECCITSGEIMATSEEQAKSKAIQQVTNWIQDINDQMLEEVFQINCDLIKITVSDDQTERVHYLDSEEFNAL